MQTLGSLIDLLITVDFKMWNAQEELYQIRHMTFYDFKKHFSTEENQLKIYDVFKKSCDLNYQRNQLIDEIDKYFVAILDHIIMSSTPQETWKNIKEDLVQLKHKTY